MHQQQKFKPITTRPKEPFFALKAPARTIMARFLTRVVIFKFLDSDSELLTSYLFNYTNHFAGSLSPMS